MNNNCELTLFYDGQCPFCKAEMTRLERWDQHHRLCFVDVANPSFDIATTGVTFADLDRELHCMTQSGEMLKGLDSMLAAYTLVDKAYLVLPLRIPFLRPYLSKAYLAFARNRYKFSRLLGYGKSASNPLCERGVCQSVYVKTA
jgi:predicted DCC family thiol-disulfide oxidoreductase YuxK